MSQERWKYWIGDDGLVHIKEADMPRPVLGNPSLTAGGYGINLNIQRNPDYYEFKAEILRVTGTDHIIVHQPGDPCPDDPPLNDK
jgi:hypothetical protein